MIAEILNIKQNILKQQVELENMKQKNIQTLNILDKVLNYNCEHKLIKDTTCAFDDKYNMKCVKCGINF